MIKNDELKVRFAREARKIKYLTNRKKEKTPLENCCSCICFKRDKDSDEESSSDSDDPTKPREVNLKIVDMLIFRESIPAWQIYDHFVNVAAAISSYFYLFMASSRNAIADDEFNS
jgi:hypothetical protein